MLDFLTFPGKDALLISFGKVSQSYEAHGENYWNPWSTEKNVRSGNSVLLRRLYICASPSMQPSFPHYVLFFFLPRLLGPEKASYFLYPSTLDQLVSPRVQRLLAADLGKPFTGSKKCQWFPNFFNLWLP